jgi:hypothetical protein
MKDLIIGAADNYGWPQVKIWATSIKQSGFAGDVVLITYRVTEELIKNCQELGIYVLSAEHDETGREINHTLGNISTQSHKIRNFHIWQFLSDNDPYRMVAVTDTRDIYFQTNPSIFFDSHQEHDIYFPSEGMYITHEWWNSDMIGNLFGSYILGAVENSVVCNSGTLFGRGEAIKKLMLNMYLIAKNFPATGADQPTMNVIKELFPPQNSTVLNMDAGWACQCATTMEPARASIRHHVLEPIPTIIETDTGFKVVNSKGNEFVIVHQYDREPILSQLVNKKFV